MLVVLHQEVEPFMNMDVDAFEKITKIKNGLTGFELPEGAGIFEVNVWCRWYH